MVTRPTPDSGLRADQTPAADLSAEEQKKILESDTADNSVKSDEKPLTGKRLRAIPAVITNSGDHASRVEVRASDFDAHGIKHDTVVFDRFKDNYTIAVGPGSAQISEEAANLLSKNWPTSFEYIED